MGRSPSLLLAVTALSACAAGAPARAPDARPTDDARPAPRVAFAIAPRIDGIDIRPDHAPKDLDIALLRPEVRRVTWSEGKAVDRTEQVLLVFSMVPLPRFPAEVAPRVARELTVPSDVAVVWRPGFFDAAVEAVTVRAEPLATFEDVVAAEPSESHETSVSLDSGRVTQREAAHASVRVTLRPEARARIAAFAAKHEHHPLVVVYDHWFAGEAGASADDQDFYLTFSWLDDGADERAARAFIANVESAVSARRPSRR